MPDTAPHVSVFHFTSRISSAKIRKYKLATERGMSSRVVDEQPSINSDTSKVNNDLQTPKKMNEDSPTMEPLAKKPKLTASRAEQQPDEAQEATESSRADRTSGYRIRYSESHTVDANNKLSIQTFPDTGDPIEAPKPKRPVQQLRTQSPAPPAPPKSSHVSESYGSNFASYYIAGGDDEGTPAPEAAATKAATATLQPAVPKNVPKPPCPIAPQPEKLQPGPTQVQGPQATRQEPRKRQRATRPPPNHVPMPAQIPFQTNVVVIDDVRPAVGSRPPDTIGVIIKKLEALREALSVFGRQDKPAKRADSPIPENMEKETAVNNLLALFDVNSDVNSDDNSDSNNNGSGNDSSKNTNNDTSKDTRNATSKDTSNDTSKDTSNDTNNNTSNRNIKGNSDEDSTNAKNDTNATSVQTQTASCLGRFLGDCGQPDIPLTHGIQFIQTALRSWANQRLNQMYAQHCLNELEKYQAQVTPQKRGPGRPRKFTVSEQDRNRYHLPAPNVQMLLSGSLEGKAVKAFQDVLDSGCLRVGAVLPIELSRALCNLYLQIENLINQGKADDPEWHCMSYSAQIKAHQTRLESWKEHQAKATEEMARQQHIARQHVMQQMGVSSKQATHQPVMQRQPQDLAQNRQTVAEMVAQKVVQQRAPGKSPSLMMNGTNAPPTAAIVPSTPSSESIAAKPSSSHPRLSGDLTGIRTLKESNNAKGKDPARGKLPRHLPGAFPTRSVQSVKSSFAPESQQAVTAFGAQAPPNHAKCVPAVTNATKFPTATSPTPTLSLKRPRSFSDGMTTKGSDQIFKPNGLLNGSGWDSSKDMGNSATKKAATIAKDNSSVPQAATKTNGFTPINRPSIAVQSPAQTPNGSTPDLCMAGPAP